MYQSPQAAAQAVADLAQRIGASQLTEQHGDELCPAGETFGGTLSSVLLYECGELGSRKVMEQLIEQASDLYDWIALLWAAFGEASSQELIANDNYRRALILFQTARTCLGQEWPQIEHFPGCLFNPKSPAILVTWRSFTRTLEILTSFRRQSSDRKSTRLNS